MISVFMSISLWAQVAVLDVLHILDCLGQVNADYLQVLYLGRAPRTKETLPDFLKWRRVTRHPLVFRGFTGSQRTPGFWGVTAWAGRDKCMPSMRATYAGCARHARDKLVVRTAAPTTWALRAQCACDLGFGCAHCAPNPVS